MQWSNKPVILIGAGAAGADLDKVMSLGVPVLTSWQAIDLVDNYHENYYGRPGLYGQRCANRIFYGADMVLSLGCRMSIWTVGYEKLDKRIVMVDVDPHEIGNHRAEPFFMTCAQFVQETKFKQADIIQWKRECDGWREQYPWYEPQTHADTERINTHHFMHELQRYLNPDQVIVTDMGSAMIAAHQILRLKPPQRLMSSGGLGEMGCALPAAIGASFARNNGEVLCLHCDGGMMMNLQELQTIVHHKLPIKIILFRNDGYLMIRHTLKTAGQADTCVTPETGVSFPDYRKISYAMGIPAADVFSWSQFRTAIPQMFATDGPALVQYHMAPMQPLVPKLDPIYVNGKATSPEFWDMSPRLC